MKTPVLFRVWKTDHTDIFALFPTIQAVGYEVTSYQHVGGHGAADCDLCIRNSRPATPEEYSDLLAELRGIGYDPTVVKRRTSRMRIDFNNNMDGKAVSQC